MWVICLEGGLNCAGLSDFICTDEQVTLRDTRCRILQPAGFQEFYGRLPQHYDHAVDCGVVFYCVTLEINCCLLFFFFFLNWWCGSAQWNFWLALSPGSEWILFLGEMEPKWFFNIWQWCGQRNPGIGTMSPIAVVMLRFQSTGIWREGAMEVIHWVWKAGGIFIPCALSSPLPFAKQQTNQEQKMSVYFPFSPTLCLAFEDSAGLQSCLNNACFQPLFPWHGKACGLHWGERRMCVSPGRVLNHRALAGRLRGSWILWHWFRLWLQQNEFAVSGWADKASCKGAASMHRYHPCGSRGFWCWSCAGLKVLFQAWALLCNWDSQCADCGPV